MKSEAKGPRVNLSQAKQTNSILHFASRMKIIFVHGVRIIVKVIKNEHTLLICFEQTYCSTEYLLMGTGGQESYSMCATWLIIMFTNVCGWTLS